eukprot:gnl/Hemi2/2529_TR895_c0_g1_i1.p3 gnl/Hemi2/2529_TR895_c0_g1~~gnl/Hemi2/2529_TR895_c0_g1_i1.p3  ORF type:complete len:195 (-),score=5.41 gnl/Hemi2/2529_TR895_c0_g1_i1:1098-1682(-)
MALNSATGALQAQPYGASTSNWAPGQLSVSGNPFQSNLYAVAEPAPISNNAYDNTFASAWSRDFPVEALAPVGGPDSSERQLDLAGLMPASWRTQDQNKFAQVQGGERDTGSGWDSYVPSRESYEAYNSTAGSARLAESTRWKSPTGSQINEIFPGRLAPPLPLSTVQATFNDSEARQSLCFNALGLWPGESTC